MMIPLWGWKKEKNALVIKNISGHMCTEILQPAIIARPSPSRLFIGGEAFEPRADECYRF